MKLAKEHEVDPGGSLTRLATEDYVDTHAGPGPDAPLVTDDFSADSRSNYTFPDGLNLGGGGAGHAAVSGGKLLSNYNVWVAAYVTALAAADGFVTKLKLNVPSSGRVYSGLISKLIDGNNYCGIQVSTDSNQIQGFQIVAGGYAPLVACALPVRSTDYWLVSKLRGNKLIGLVYDADPEVNPENIVAACVSIINAAIATGHPGKPGIFMAELDSPGSVPYDDFRVWAQDATLPFGI